MGPDLPTLVGEFGEFFLFDRVVQHREIVSHGERALVFAQPTRAFGHALFTAR